ncbi:MAG: HD domain-containing protein [Patescibacteria group bacterium]|jgi:putative hydrolase of HD superfamily
MQTKNKHSKDLFTEKSHHMIELFFEFAQLKNLYRQGWLKRGVSKVDCETVADHAFGVALMAYILAEEYRSDLDSQKVMLLALFHEIGEIYTGDITPVDGVSLEDKSAREYDSVQKVFSHLPRPAKYVNIWLEYEKQETAEAKFVEQIDRLEMALQANLYERLDYKNLDEFFEHAQRRITLPELKPILEELLKTR